MSDCEHCHLMPQTCLANGHEMDGLINPVRAFGIAASQEKVRHPHDLTTMRRLVLVSTRRIAQRSDAAKPCISLISDGKPRVNVSLDTSPPAEYGPNETVPATA
jgi:hypothetical protein